MEAAYCKYMGCSVFSEVIIGIFIKKCGIPKEDSHYYSPALIGKAAAEQKLLFAELPFVAFSKCKPCGFLLNRTHSSHRTYPAALKVFCIIEAMRVASCQGMLRLHIKGYAAV